ncbi:putative reverse transcriptase domain-containing protein [Tanacetum coccineum]
MDYHLLFMRLRAMRFVLPLHNEAARTTPGPGYDVGEVSHGGASQLGYGITDTWDDLVGAIQEIAPTTLEGVNQRVTELATTVDQEDDIIYSQLDDARHNRALLRAQVSVSMMIAIRYVQRQISLGLWHGSQSEIAELQAADRRRQTMISDLLKADYRRQRHCTAALINRNGDDSHTSGTGARRPVQVARECTYPDFLKCQPLNFKGTEGVVKLQRVPCKKCSYMVEPHVKTTTLDAAPCNAMRTLKKMMTDKYCPRGEIKKLEFEMWNLKVKGNDVVAYSQRFQELALMCDRMFPEEIDQVEKYVGGLPTHLHYTRDKTRGRAHAAGNDDRKPYGGPKTLCSKCNNHHGVLVLQMQASATDLAFSRDCRSPPKCQHWLNQRLF